jgi:hypothetical protein
MHNQTTMWWHLFGFYLRCPPQTHVLVASWWDFEKWLNPEGSDLINEVIPWWIHTWLHYWEVVKSRRWGPVERASHWDVSLEATSCLGSFLYSLSLPSVHHRCIASAMCSGHHDSLHHQTERTLQPQSLGINVDKDLEK